MFYVYDLLASLVIYVLRYTPKCPRLTCNDLRKMYDKKLSECRYWRGEGGNTGDAVVSILEDYPRLHSSHAVYPISEEYVVDFQTCKVTSS